MAPHADVIYACDARWWKYHGDEVCRQFRGARWTHQDADEPRPEQDEVANRYGLQQAMGRRRDGLGRDVMHYGDNSGYQAINLAYLWGAGRILLIGYDMQRTGGRSHWFGDHPPELNAGSEYSAWAVRFRPLAADLRDEGVEVINCSRATAIDAFPLAALADVL